MTRIPGGAFCYGKVAVTYATSLLFLKWQATQNTYGKYAQWFTSQYSYFCQHFVLQNRPAVLCECVCVIFFSWAF